MLRYDHFQAECLNRRALTITEIEEIDHIVLEPDEKDAEEEEEDIILAPKVGEFLVLKRVLQTTEALKEENQSKLIFHSRCAIQGKVYSLITDGGSRTNVASSHLIDKLKLPTIPHPRPYSLQWLKKGNEVHVTKQALITYTIGNFKDEFLCDMLPIDACYLLLGRPWQFYKGAIYNGTTNTYTFKVKDRNYTLTPLPLNQI